MTDWSLSSSSEDDEDAHYFQSKIREDSVYYEKFLRGEYGTDEWADHIPRFMNLGLNNINENRSSFANDSISNGTMPTALHLPCSVPDRVMVLNRDTNQYEIMRYVEVANGAVITPEAEVILPETINGSTASHNSFNPLPLPRGTQHVNEGTKTISKFKVHKEILIPLEPVDLIDAPKDRRKRKPEPEDLMELPPPSFYYKIEWNGKEWVPAKKPKLDKSHGFKPSMSYQRERLDRVNRHQQRYDPRLQKDLFSSPKRIEEQTTRNNKHDSAKENVNNMFGSDSDSSITGSRSGSPTMSPALSDFMSRSNFAAERNSTILPRNCSSSSLTTSDIGLSDSDTIEEKTKRKLRSQSRRNKKCRDKFEDKENEKVPPLVIKLPKKVNSIDQGHSSKKQPKNKENINIVPPKLLKPPKDIHDLKNDVIAAMQGEFPDDEDLTNKDEKKTTEKCEEAVPTQFNESINQTNNTVPYVIESMEMDVVGDTVAESSTSTNPQPKKKESKVAGLELDDISDNEMLHEQPEMVSHGNLTDLEDVSIDESDDNVANNLDDISVDDNILAEAVKEVLGENDNVEHRPNTTGTSEVLEEIEKDLALLDNDNDESDMDRFVEADDKKENITTPNPNDRQELIKILDPNSSEEQDANAIGSAESGPENMQTEHEADNFDVPEIGATADVGATIEIQSDQLILDKFNDVNSFGRPKNSMPDSADETYRLKITIQLFEYEIAENEQEKLFREDDNDEEHCNSVGEATVEQVEQLMETEVRKYENDKMDVDCNSIETSEDDQEYDHPIASDNYVMPNSNTDRRVTQTNLKCTMCPYKDMVEWKKLTKHYIRKHPDTEIAHSRLAERFKLDEIIANPMCSTVTDRMLIKSMCLFCDQYYCLNSSKWEKHFVSHTGECPFECRKCGSKLFDDLHKRCNSKNNIAINGPHEFKENKLYGYVCKLCNFVQLDKKNISKHIDNQHQAMQNEESVAEIFLINVTETASSPSNIDGLHIVEVDSDSEDDKPLNKILPQKSPSKVFSDTIDLTITDSDPDID